MSVTDGYLAAADQAVALLREPAVAASWDRPSALAGMTVGGLAGHLAYQIFSVGAALAGLREKLPGLPSEQAVFMPQTGWALSLGDFLTTRTMELAVHMDDLAVSAGLAPQELPDAAFDPVLILLARLAARRHGQAALLRALARVERAPAAINAL